MSQKDSDVLELIKPGVTYEIIYIGEQYAAAAVMLKLLEDEKIREKERIQSVG